jgi:hypothetical protein
LPLALCAKSIDTFYGPIEVDEPVILELIESPVFQRLKNIHQYGVAYYTTHREEYNRYDHSIGVFAILRKNNASIEEQIAGLLHDVSHTVFSHVGDWVYGKENQDIDYQNNIHPQFLKESGLGDILEKYQFSIDQILPKEEMFPALENKVPNLCADRIDYNIQGAFYRGFITYEEALLIYGDLRFIDRRWISSDPTLMKKLTRFSIFMTMDCWGGIENYIKSRWLVDAILRAIDLGCISHEEFHYGTDDEIWNKLCEQTDPFILQKMKMILNPEKFYSIVDIADEAEYCITSKFRGINPWVLIGSQCKRLLDIDDELAKEFEGAREIVQQGWFVKTIEIIAKNKGFITNYRF